MSSSVNVRRPFAGEMKPIESPDDPNTIFTIKRCSNRENLARKNMASTVRMIQEESGSQRFVQERDFPVGDMELETIFLGLHGWNLCGDDKNPIPPTRDNILLYLSPNEYQHLYGAILDMNPVWRGEAEVKKD